MTTDILRLTELPPLRRDQVIERLRDAIIAGHFKPGDRLIERELCERMGVSRTSIREALRHLEAEHLIDVEPRRGPVVTRITRKQITEIYEVRALLEGALVRRFAEVASEAEIAALRRIYEDMGQGQSAGDVQRVVERGRRFTEQMIDVVNHELIGDMLRKLAARISVVRVLAIAVPGRFQESRHELTLVVEAIERRDGELAARSLINFVQNAAAAALQRFDETERERESAASKSIRTPRVVPQQRSGVGRK